MLLPRLGALLLAVSAAQAFRNTSPFFLLSSKPLESDNAVHSTQIALSSDVENKLIESLQSCDRKWYYIFSQSAVSANDLKDGAMPKLQETIASADRSSVVEIPEVAVSGGLSAQSIHSRLETACSSKGKKSVDSWPTKEDEYCIVEMQLPELPSDSEARAKVMKDIDDAIDDAATAVMEKGHDAVLIYITTPLPRSTMNQQDGSPYEMDDPYPTAPHTELRRNLGLQARQSDSDDMQAGLPLFEKYQFLSPPIFMGLTVSILLLLILYVGISAISGLSVTYMAFNKEMGPNASKKQQ